MSPPKPLDVDCEFVVSENGKEVVITIKSDVPVFAYKDGAQIIVDAVADSSIHYYSITDDEWEKMSGRDQLDS